MPDTAEVRQWSPHMWEGMEFFAWCRLLGPNLAAVRPSKWYVAAIVSGVSLVHTALKLIQDGCYRHRLRRVAVPPPVFILGHWRSGTTLLHELLICDPRHSFPNTYHCFEPNHPLLTEAVTKALLPRLVPSRRPMDAMAAGWDRPQEDEFALALAGQPSPYLFLAFPDRPSPDPDALDFAGWPPGRVRRWQRAFRDFLRVIGFLYPGRRPVLKSPTHTARLRVLLELFPDARFVYAARDPVALFASTRKLWRSLAREHALQRPNFSGLDEQILSTFERLDAAYRRDRPLLRGDQLIELKYEDLIADPVGQLRAVYDRLALGDFSAVEPRVTAYLDAVRGHPVGRYEVEPELRRSIGRRWGDYARRYGYVV